MRGSAVVEEGVPRALVELQIMRDVRDGEGMTKRPDHAPCEPIRARVAADDRAGACECREGRGFWP